MNDFNITKRVEECYKNGFDNLLDMFNGIMISIIETEVPQYQVKAELIHWCHHVDNSLDALNQHRTTSTQLTVDNLLAQANEVFGTEV